MGLPYSEVYRYAAEKVDLALKSFLGDDQVNSLSIYGLSYDNLVNRGAEELDPIFRAQEERYRMWLSDPFFSVNKVRVIFPGDTRLFFERLPPSYLKVMKDLEDRTAENDWKSLFILIGHSGRRSVVPPSAGEFDGTYPPFGSRNGNPPNIDLVVRTGGRMRLSDSLPLQTAYAELYVIDKLIPEIETSDLRSALDHLAGSVRNYGT